MHAANLAPVLLCGLLACNSAQPGARTDGGLDQICAGSDGDGDGLCDDDELAFGSDPLYADTDGDGLNDFQERQAGTNPRSADTDRDGLTDREEVFLGSDPLHSDGACASAQSDATPVARPVDIIFVVDNSSSMNAEIEAVQDNINNNFASIIETSGIDYRIIMIARHGPTSDASICVSMPLSGHSCSPIPEQPTNSARYFHYSTEIDSHNSLSEIIRTYRTEDEFLLAPRGWSEWLRPAAFKVFVEFSDDNSSSRANSVDSALTALDPAQFGTREHRNYVFHSIVGVTPKAVTTEAYLPAEPVQTRACPGNNLAVNAGSAYQELSRLSGGLRFPLCRFSEYDVIFRAIAQGVADGLTLPCSYSVPTSAGQPIDTQRILLKYTPRTGAAMILQRVASMSQCRSGGWYLDSEQQRINLCDQTCSWFAGNAPASIQVLVACGIDLH